MLMFLSISVLGANIQFSGITLVNPNHVMNSSAVTPSLNSGDALHADRTDLAIVPQRIPHATLGAGASSWPTSRILKEVGKQAIDQPGHFLIGAAPIWASRYLVGVPWFGWVTAPILAYREWLQWPSNRWWDPPLDWAFLGLGAVVATCRRRLTDGLAGGLPPLWRRIAWNRRTARQAGDRVPDLLNAPARIPSTAHWLRSRNTGMAVGYRR
jgi:hypothetical protein